VVRPLQPTTSVTANEIGLMESMRRADESPTCRDVNSTHVPTTSIKRPGAHSSRSVIYSSARPDSAAAMKDPDVDKKRRRH